MKNKKIKKISSLLSSFLAIMIPILIYALSATPVSAHNQVIIKVESSTTPDMKRTGPLPHPTSSNILPAGTPAPSGQTIMQSQTATLGPNLIPNPSLEDTNPQGNPTNWNKGGYGTNTRVYSYPVGGSGDAKAAQVSVSNYTAGDAKWFFNDISVTPGTVYQFSDYSKSDVPSIVDVRYKMSDGSFLYKDIASVNPSSTYQNTTVQITIPQNVVSLTIFHLIKTNGTLTVDQYALNQVTVPPPPPPSPNNLVPNGDFETTGVNGLPQGWSKGGYGTNTRAFSYPVTGVSGSKASYVSIASYTTGDAKWYFNPISVSPGIYTYSDQYMSDVPSIITVQFNNTDGSVSYKDIASLSATKSFTNFSADFGVSAGVQSITIFHLIKSVGNLSLDNVSVQRKEGSASGIFSTGAVTLRFDDGWLSQYQKAIPKMNSVGIKGTFYIVSKQTADDNFAGFMSKAQIKEIYSMGNEIGAHTRTHPFLTKLSAAEQQNEIQGSRSDLLSLNVGPMLSFAYPYGDYNSTTVSIVQNAGFTSAAATLNGFVSPTSDRYQLERQGLLANTSLSQVKQLIDEAQANKRWLILTFHEINTTGETYSITPTMFDQIVDYLVQKKIPVITVSAGMQSL